MPISAATDDPFMNVARQMNKMRERIQKSAFRFMPGENWTPNVNLYEAEKAYLVCVDLAGVDKEKIDVVVEDQVLTLRGNRAVPLYEDETPEKARLRVHLMEIDHGAFSREVDLPHDVERDKIRASYRNGMLWIELPKK